MNPKVLHFGKYYPPNRGGMETHLELLAEGLTQKEWEIHILASSNNKSNQIRKVHGVHIHECAQWFKPFSLPFCPRLPYQLLKSSADLYHLHVPNPLGDLSFSLSSKMPYLVTYHSPIFRQKKVAQWLRPLFKRTLDRAERIILTWPDQIQASEDLKQNESKCHCIPLAINPQPYLDTEKNLSALNLPAAFEQGYFLFVGRLVSYKGLPVLLQALKSSKEKTKLIVVGSGPMLSDIQKLQLDPELKDRVIHAGQVDQNKLIQLFLHARALVFPSIHLSEQFGLVQLEAFAAKIPVINTQLPSGVPWVGLQNEGAITLEPGNVKALAEAMDLLHQSPSMARELGLKGHARMKAQFSLDSMIQKTDQLYREVLG